MKTLSYELRFTTPAFLGNAEQNGQWRTPPFKALLRQWWRVTYAAEHGFRVNESHMRHAEGLLFGHAWLDDDHDERGEKVPARRGLVRIRLDRWDRGDLTSWQGLEQMTVFHPEADKVGFKVGPHAYLGYGPLDGRSGTRLEKRNAAIRPGTSAVLSIAVPEEHLARIQHALWLMDRYATVGGRSRNGWGSVSVAPLNDAPALVGTLPSRLLGDALALDWPHAIGCDDRGALVWTTKPFSDWKRRWRIIMSSSA
jgi:CRISPR-associated protein Cmr1